jgi:hypothetical protein
MCAPSPPPPPDYAAAADAQGAANVETARVQGTLNRPDEYGPTGSRTWTDLGNDRWRVDTNLSPEQKALYDQNVATQTTMGQAANTAANNATDILGRPVDLSGVPPMPGNGEETRAKVMEAMMGRLEPKFAQDADAMRSNMVARGFREGDEAWNREQDQLNQAKNDARQQAYLASGTEAQRDYGMGMDTRRQAITEAMLERQTPINEISALLSGSQVSAPNFQPYYSTGNIAPPPVYGAARDAGQYGMDTYNADVGQYNNNVGTVGKVGSAAAMAMLMGSMF